MNRFRCLGMFRSTRVRERLLASRNAPAQALAPHAVQGRRPRPPKNVGNTHGGEDADVGTVPLEGRTLEGVGEDDGWMLRPR